MKRFKTHQRYERNAYKYVYEYNARSSRWRSMCFWFINYSCRFGGYYKINEMKKILYHPKEGTTGFFLGDFPDEPIDHNVYPRDTWNMIYEDYKRILLKCKEEAIKNGEIMNTEEIERKLYSSDSRITGPMSFDAWKRIVLKAGDIFDLPEGVGFEKFEKCIECDAESNQDCKNGPDACDVRNRCFIRLVPSDKEDDRCPFSDMIKNSKQESQDELWDEFFNLYGGGVIPIHLKSKFTITRKEK